MDTIPNLQPTENPQPQAATTPEATPAAPRVAPPPKTLQERMAAKYEKTKTEPCTDCPDGRVAWGSGEPT